MLYFDQYNKLPDHLKGLIYPIAWKMKKPTQHISKHFKVKEVICPSGCQLMPHPLSMACLELLRIIVKKPFIITSAARCKDYNKKIGGAKGSHHVIGQAFDIKVNSIFTRSIIKSIFKIEDLYLNAIYHIISPYPKHLHLSILSEYKTPKLFPGQYK